VTACCFVLGGSSRRSLRTAIPENSYNLLIGSCTCFFDPIVSSLVMDAFYASLGAIVFAAVAFKLHTTHSFPRVGNPTPFGIGYLITALKGITQTWELLEEGIKKYGGRPFVLPTLAGSILCSTNKGDVELLWKSDDHVVSESCPYIGRVSQAYISFHSGTNQLRRTRSSSIQRKFAIWSDLLLATTEPSTGPHPE
jgi:hypothetical protein